jgi:hypothetical protein
MEDPKTLRLYQRSCLRRLRRLFRGIELPERRAAKKLPLGRKRKINLSNCNKDFSCLNGFCPSFVTVEGADTAQAENAGYRSRLARNLMRGRCPSRTLPALDTPFDLVVTGVGGTGVVTIGATHHDGRASGRQGRERTRLSQASRRNSARC